MTTFTVRATYEQADEYTAQSWAVACGRAVTEAITGARSVVLTDANGSQWNVYVSPVEDNS